MPPVVVASLRDRLRRADFDAGVAADLLVAAVRADLLLVLEEARLLELADHVAQLQHRVDQRGVVRRMEVALRRLVQREQRRLRSGRAPGRSARSTSCGSRVKSIAPAASHTRTQSRCDAALVEVDLVAEVDRAFGAHVDAGIAARAQVEVDRVAALPAHVERAEPAADALHACRRARRACAPARPCRRCASTAGSRRAGRRACARRARLRRRRRSRARARPTCSDTVATGSGSGSCAAASSAAIFGVAAFASFDQPPVSRMLTKRIGRSCTLGAPSVCSFSSTKQPAFLRAGDEQLVAALGRALERAGFAPAQHRVNRLQPVSAPAGRAPGSAPPRPAASSGCSRRSASSSGGTAGELVARPAAVARTADCDSWRRRSAIRFGHGLFLLSALLARTAAGTSTAPSCAASASVIGVRDVVVVDVGVEPVHHVEVRVGEKLLHRRALDAFIDARRDETREVGAARQLGDVVHRRWGRRSSRWVCVAGDSRSAACAAAGVDQAAQQARARRCSLLAAAHRA